MSKFFQVNFAKLQNIGKLANQGGLRKENAGDTLELSTNENNAAGPSVPTFEIKTVTKTDCENVQNLKDLFDSVELKQEFEDQTTVLLLKIPVNDLFDDLNQEVLEDINRKCFKKSIVIFVTSENSNKASIYWKSKDIQQLITLVHYEEEFTENDSKIYKFVADYLSKSLSKGELGLYREWQQYSNGHEVGAHLLADTRDYNLLLIAAESGNAEIVQILLNCGANTVADDGVGAHDLAWNNRHSEVLLVLAQANLPYPDGIDINQLSDDFKTFYKNTQELHAAIIEKNEEKVKEILNCDKNLEFYFDLSNKSAARIAVDAKAFDIYEILVIHEIFLAPHEYQQGIFDDLQYTDQKLIRELHHKHSKDLPDKHINVLMAHSFISHDVPDAQGKLKYVYEAYKHLSQDSRLSTILKVVAASKNARIIYDFNRDAVNIADPTTSGNTEGVFYPMGRIYIGARQLLDENTRSQAIGTLAHELCHYAINLTYCNKAQPYKRNDNQTLQEFEEINEKCQKEKGKEEVVDLVHECYPVDMHHAELIVRPAHLIALYMDQPEKLAQLGQTFPDLFEFFNRIIKEMEAAIPEIERRDEVEIEKKDQKISKLRKKLVLSGIFSVIGIIAVAAIVAMIFYKPIYSFKGLSESNKLKVTNAPIIYKNIEVRFHDLFPTNSTAYYNLTSDHISQILDEQALNFSDPHLSYLNDLVRHDWENLAGKLKQKFLTSNFTFQNESLKFEKLGELNSEVFKSLSSEKIVDVLDGNELVVGTMIENKTEFYVERRFIFQGAAVNSANVTYFTNVEDTMDDIMDKTTRARVFILSSEAGAGKTVTFEQLAMKIKRKFPMRWVSYIDLKEYTRFYSLTPENVDIKKLLHNILNLNSEKEFEKRIFDELYNSGNVILLWNGFDEISPTYNYFIQVVFNTIHKTTENIQHVSTRPLYSAQLQNIFLKRAYELIPFNEKEQREFLRKFFIIQKVNSSKIDEYVDKVHNIALTHNFITPFMLKVIGTIHEEDNLLEKQNFYKIFKIFIEKKIEIWQESEYGQNITRKLLSGSFKFNIMEFHQNFALKVQLRFVLKLHKLKIMQNTIPSDLRYEEISRMGILYMNGPFEFNFSHRTFVDYLTAQYFYENFYMADCDMNIMEAELRTEAFIHISVSLQNSELYYKFIKNFINSDDVGKTFCPAISMLLRTNYKRLFFDIIRISNHELIVFLIEFFKRDHDILIDLLHVNENETFYTGLFNPFYKSNNLQPDKIMNVVKNYLNDEEFDKFINGRNQKGKILYGMHYYNLSNVQKVHHNYENNFNSSTSLQTVKDKFLSNLSEDEQREVLEVVIQPTIYDSNKILYEDYEKNWPKIEKLFPRKKLISLIGKTIRSFCEICPPTNTTFHRLLLNKSEELFTSDEIIEMYVTESILHKAVLKQYFFNSFWNVLVKHTNQTVRRNILMQKAPLQYIRYYQIGFQQYGLFTYDYTKLNILHIGLSFCHDSDYFYKLVSIYESHFNQSEMQQFFNESNDFLLYATIYANRNCIIHIFEYFLKLFVGAEHILVEFFRRNINLTNKTFFKFIRYFGLVEAQGINVQTYYDIYLLARSLSEKTQFTQISYLADPISW